MKSAFITGGADGIGAGLARRLASLGYAVTIADINFARASSVANEIISSGGQALAVACDVTNESSQIAAFEAHAQRFGTLDIAILNAGIMESGDFLSDKSDAWQLSLKVNLLGVLYGVRCAVHTMASLGTRGGAILTVASAGGIFPMPLGPIYAAAKSGVVMLTHSLGPTLLKTRGIRLCALCPEYVDTALVRGVKETRGDAVAKALLKPVQGKLLTVDYVADVAIKMLSWADAAGKSVVVLSNGQLMTPSRPRLRELIVPGGSLSTASTPLPRFSIVDLPIPTTARKIIVTKLSPNFRQATQLVSFPLPSSIPPNCVLIQNFYCGVNASDVNFSSGRYQSGGGSSQPPFDAGFEACGVVAAIGSGVQGISVGQPVATMQYGGFSEYAFVNAKHCIPVPTPSPAVLALLTNGLTASISLEQTARLQKGETVLVTAAAGGTGQFFVQLAKAAGAHVIATCGSDEKGAMLRRLGADRVVNYRTEDLKQVLKAEYPKGIDLVCELVGGDMFKICFNALAPRGRLLIIGAVSQYSAGWKPSTHVGLPEKLLAKSTSLLGFFLPQYASHWKQHLRQLVKALDEGKLQVELDPRQFVGIESVFDAVDHLQSGQSMGKVYVQLKKGGDGAAKL